MEKRISTNEFLKSNLDLKKDMKNIIKVIEKNRITNLQLIIATITIVFDSFGIPLTVRSAKEIDELIIKIQESTEKLVKENELKFE